MDDVIVKIILTTWWIKGNELFIRKAILNYVELEICNEEILKTSSSGSYDPVYTGLPDEFGIVSKCSRLRRVYRRNRADFGSTFVR